MYSIACMFINSLLHLSNLPLHEHILICFSFLIPSISTLTNGSWSILIALLFGKYNHNLAPDSLGIIILLSKAYHKPCYGTTFKGV